MEKKNKKRFGIVAFALLMFLAVGATAGLTLAKYISEGSIPSNKATIAKWGLTVSVDADNLFGTEYKGTGLAKTNGDGSVVVKGASTVVAPGTSGSVTFSVTGTAEVNAQFSVTVGSSFKTAYLKKGTEYYSPIKWKVGNTYVTAPTGADVADSTKWKEAFASAISSELTNSKYTAGQAEAVNISLTISWEWDYSTNSANDEKDTILGRIAQAGSTADFAEYAGSNCEIVLDVTGTIAQIQA